MKLISPNGNLTSKVKEQGPVKVTVTRHSNT